MSVPEFNGYFPSESDMDSTQHSFYMVLEPKLKKGEYLDIEGNIGYVFVFLYKLLAKWKDKGFENLYEYLIFLSELYIKEEKLSSYCLFWAHDCLLGLKQYEEFLEKTEPEHAFGTSTHYSNLRLNIQKHLGLSANPIDIVLMVGGRQTKFIQNNEALYKDKIHEMFNDYENKNVDWFKVFEKWQPKGNKYGHTLFNGALIYSKPAIEFKIETFYAAYDYLNIIRDLTKKAENAARETCGVPKIGEGWISETSLYKKLEGEFSSTIIIQHGQPQWLGRQHFDIWFPNWKIAVEYHGKQHFEPVEYFGGIEGLKKTQERDTKKKNLAEKHGVKLLIIKEDDNQGDLIQSIYKLREGKKVVPPIA